MTGSGIQGDVVLFIICVITSLISCVSAVVAVIHARKPVSVELQDDVSVLADSVEKLLKEQRSRKMKDVRAAANDKPNGSTETAASLDVSAATFPAPGQRKQELRRIAKMRGFN